MTPSTPGSQIVFDIPFLESKNGQIIWPSTSKNPWPCLLHWKSNNLTFLFKVLATQCDWDQQLDHDAVLPLESTNLNALVMHSRCLGTSPGPAGLEQDYWIPNGIEPLTEELITTLITYLGLLRVMFHLRVEGTNTHNSQNCTRLRLMQLLDCYSYNYSLIAHKYMRLSILITLVLCPKLTISLAFMLSSVSFQEYIDISGINPHAATQ